MITFSFEHDLSYQMVFTLLFAFVAGFCFPLRGSQKCSEFCQWLQRQTHWVPVPQSGQASETLGKELVHCGTIRGSAQAQAFASVQWCLGVRKVQSIGKKWKVCISTEMVHSTLPCKCSKSFLNQILLLIICRRMTFTYPRVSKLNITCF